MTREKRRITACSKLLIKSSPLLITLSVAAFIYLSYFESRCSLILIGFLRSENYDGVCLLCNEISLWTRCALFLLSAVCFAPYVLTHVAKICEDEDERWTKLGLIAGIVIFFTASVAAPDGSLALSMKNVQFSNNMSLLPLQVRQLFTSFQNIFYSLSFPVLFHVFFNLKAQRDKRSRVWQKIAFWICLIGILFYNPKMYSDFYNTSLGYYFGAYVSPAFVGLALVIDCRSAMLCEKSVKEEAKSPKGSIEALAQQLFRLHGVLLGIMCLVIIILFVWFLADKGRRWGETDKILGLLEYVFIAALFAGGISVFCRAFLYKTKDIYAFSALPMYFLMRLGFIMDFRYGELAPAPYPYAWNYWNPLIPELWFFPAVAILIYALYLFYDYGLKNRPKIYLLITFALIALMYVPHFDLSNGQGLTAIAVTNIVFGLSAPALLVRFGQPQEEKNGTIKYVWDSIESRQRRFEKYGRIYWLISGFVLISCIFILIFEELGLVYLSLDAIVYAIIFAPIFSLSSRLLFGLKLMGISSRESVIRAILLPALIIGTFIAMLMALLNLTALSDIATACILFLVVLLYFLIPYSALWDICAGRKIIAKAAFKHILKRLLVGLPLCVILSFAIVSGEEIASTFSLIGVVALPYLLGTYQIYRSIRNYATTESKSMDAEFT